MNLPVPLALVRKSLTEATKRKKGQIKPNLRSALARRSAFLVVSALCGLVIAGSHIIPKLTNRNSLPATTVATQQKATASKSADTPAQDNPLFATTPSWSQNFAGQTSGQPDPRYWNTLVGPAENSNKEQQYYSANSANVRIEDGALRLIATHQAEPDGYNYGSARLETEGKQAFLYGRIDITAKLPSGVGTWPAIWLLPDNNIYADKSPTSNTLRYKNGGEIDILEAVGFQPDIIYGIAHTVSDLSRHPDGTGSYSAVNVPNSSTTFNKYTLLWTPTSMTFAVNDKSYYTYTRASGADYTSWPFDQPFYLIANLAMGGSWGGMDTAHYPGNGIDNSALPASLDIRSIYYYPYTGSANAK